MNGKDFKAVAGMLYVAEVTAQICAIDSFAEGAPIDHMRLPNLQATEEKFEAIQNCIEQNKDHKLLVDTRRTGSFFLQSNKICSGLYDQGFDLVNSFTYRKANREIHKTISITETVILCLNVV